MSISSNEPQRKKIVSGLKKLMPDILFHQGAYADIEYETSYDMLKEFIELENERRQTEIRNRLLEAALVPLTRKPMSRKRYSVLQNLWNKRREKYFVPTLYETPDPSMNKKLVTGILKDAFQRLFPEFTLDQKLRKAVGDPQSILFSHVIDRTKLYFMLDRGTWGPGRWSGIFIGTSEPEILYDFQQFLPYRLTTYKTAQQLSDQCDTILPILRSFSRPIF